MFFFGWFGLFPGTKTTRRPSRLSPFVFLKMASISSQAARVVARNATSGAAASMRNATNMASVIAEMDAESSMPRGQPEKAARRARAARRGALVRCIDEAQEEDDAEGREEQGRSPLQQRGRRTEAADKGKRTQTRYRRLACEGIAPWTGNGLGR